MIQRLNPNVESEHEAIVDKINEIIEVLNTNDENMHKTIDKIEVLNK